MKTELACSRCGAAFATDRDIAGQRVRCLNCGLIQSIPDASVAQSGAPRGYQLAPAPDLSLRPEPAEPDYSPPGPTKRAELSRAKWLDHLRPWVFETSQVQGIGTWLIILSLADLLMTFALLRKSPAFFESNPIAQWFFQKWNIAGMVGFKFSMIAGVILLSEIIERKRPGWGRFVLLVGCIGAAYAVFTGGRLYMAPEVPVSFERD
jgi:hypothetical protein